MAKAEIYPGNCGFSTTVEATMDGEICKLSITSDCKAIRKLAQELTEVNPFEEISFRRNNPRILQMGAKYCTHAACPVPVGMIKAVEVAANLALANDVTIKLSQ
jgi:hypothetical protein